MSKIYKITTHTVSGNIKTETLSPFDFYELLMNEMKLTESFTPFLEILEEKGLNEETYHVIETQLFDRANVPIPIQMDESSHIFEITDEFRHEFRVNDRTVHVKEFIKLYNEASEEQVTTADEVDSAYQTIVMHFENIIYPMKKFIKVPKYNTMLLSLSKNHQNYDFEIIRR